MDGVVLFVENWPVYRQERSFRANCAASGRGLPELWPTCGRQVVPSFGGYLGLLVSRLQDADSKSGGRDSQ